MPAGYFLICDQCNTHATHNPTGEGLPLHWVNVHRMEYVGQNPDPIERSFYFCDCDCLADWAGQRADIVRPILGKSASQGG